MNPTELIRELKNEIGPEHFAFPSGFHQFETMLFQGPSGVRSFVYDLGREIRNHGYDQHIDALFQNINPNHNALEIIHRIADACLELRDKFLMSMIMNIEGKYRKEFLSIFHRAGIPIYPHPSGYIGMSPPTPPSTPPPVPLHQPIIVGPPNHPQGSPAGTTPPSGPFAGRIRRGSKP